MCATKKNKQQEYELKSAFTPFLASDQDLFNPAVARDAFTAIGSCVTVTWAVVIFCLLTLTPGPRQLENFIHSTCSPATINSNYFQSKCKHHF